MSDSDQEEKRSKSQIKREFQGLKKLGTQLVALSEGNLQHIPLSDKTRAAVVAARSMTRGALQRQYRFLSALIDGEDVGSIRAALKDEHRLVLTRFDGPLDKLTVLSAGGHHGEPSPSLHPGIQA